MTGPTPDRMPVGEVVRLPELVAYQGGTVVSRTIVKGSAGTLTLFAFDAGQGLSEHTAPFDALVTVLDGEARLTVGGKEMAVGVGDSVLMPANVPHAVQATSAFKMVLVMIRNAGA